MGLAGSGSEMRIGHGKRANKHRLMGDFGPSQRGKFGA